MITSGRTSPGRPPTAQRKPPWQPSGRLSLSRRLPRRPAGPRPSTSRSGGGEPESRTLTTRDHPVACLDRRRALLILADPPCLEVLATIAGREPAVAIRVRREEVHDGKQP